MFSAQYPLPYYVPWGIGKIIPNHWGPDEETRTQGTRPALAAILVIRRLTRGAQHSPTVSTATSAGVIYLTLPYPNHRSLPDVTNE